MGRTHGDRPWQWEATWPSERLPQWERERTITHYSSLDRILLVGEGDFSFSSALADAFESADKIVATSLDSRERVVRVYKSARITIANLMARGALVLHDIDATKMDWCLRGRMFDIIIFNFPHSGFWGREQDNNVIERHKNLVRGFFESASKLLSKRGEIHVAHKLGEPYNRWNLVGEAGNYGLTLKNKVDFRAEDYPGYNNKRGDGPRTDDSFPLGPCKTFMFRQLIMGPSTELIMGPSRRGFHDNGIYNSRQPIMSRIQDCDVTMDIERATVWNYAGDTGGIDTMIPIALATERRHATSDSSSERNDDKEDQNAARWLQMNRFHFENHGLPPRGHSSQAWETRSPRPSRRRNSPPQQRQCSARVRGWTSAPLPFPQLHGWGWDTSTDGGWGTSCEEQDWCSKDCPSSTPTQQPSDVHAGWEPVSEEPTTQLGWGWLGEPT